MYLELGQKKVKVLEPGSVHTLAGSDLRFGDGPKPCFVRFRFHHAPKSAMLRSATCGRFVLYHGSAPVRELRNESRGLFPAGMVPPKISE